MKLISKKRKTAAIKRQALEQLRETRRALDAQYPELLDTMRGFVDKMGGVNETQDVSSVSDMVTIDRAKNMETILKFIELKPHSDDLKQELKKILS